MTDENDERDFRLQRLVHLLQGEDGVNSITGQDTCENE